MKNHEARVSILTSEGSMHALIDLSDLVKVIKELEIQCEKKKSKKKSGKKTG